MKLRPRVRCLAKSGGQRRDSPPILRPGALAVCHPSASAANPSSVNPLFDSSLNRPGHQLLINVGTKSSNFLRGDGNHSSTGSGTKAKKYDSAPTAMYQNRGKGDLTGKSRFTEETHGTTAKENDSDSMEKQQNRGRGDATGKSRCAAEVLEPDDCRHESLQRSKLEDAVAELDHLCRTSFQRLFSELAVRSENNCVRSTLSHADGGAFDAASDDIANAADSCSDADSDCRTVEDILDGGAIDEDFAHQRNAAPNKDLVDNKQTEHSKNPVVDDLNDDDSCVWFTSITSGTQNQYESSLSVQSQPVQPQLGSMNHSGVDLKSQKSHKTVTIFEVAKPVAKSLARPAATPIVKPVAKQLAKPVTIPPGNQVAKPVTKPVTKPAANQVANLVTKPVVNPVVNLVSDVVANLDNINRQGDCSWISSLSVSDSVVSETSTYTNYLSGSDLSEVSWIAAESSSSRVSPLVSRKRPLMCSTPNKDSGITTVGRGKASLNRAATKGGAERVSFCKAADISSVRESVHAGDTTRLLGDANESRPKSSFFDESQAPKSACFSAKYSKTSQRKFFSRPRPSRNGKFTDQDLSRKIDTGFKRWEDIQPGVLL